MARPRLSARMSVLLAFAGLLVAQVQATPQGPETFGSGGLLVVQDPDSGEVLQSLTTLPGQMVQTLLAPAGRALWGDAGPQSRVIEGPSPGSGALEDGATSPLPRRAYLVRLQGLPLLRQLPKEVSVHGRNGNSRQARAAGVRLRSGGKPTLTGQAAQKMTQADARLDAQHRAILVLLGLDPQQLPASASRIAAGRSPASASAVQPGRRVLNDYRLTFNGMNLLLNDREAQWLRNRPEVASVELDGAVKATLLQSVPLISADTFRATTGFSGSGRTIAILDTGVDYNHPDLGIGLGAGQKVIGGYDFVNLDADPMDDHGHGTHVAGTAAGNGPAVQGVAPHAKLLAYKVLDAGGSGSYAGIIAGMEAAVDPDGDPQTLDGADILSMSLGGEGGPDSAVSLAVDEATLAGVLSVVAAGNSGSNFATIDAPGAARTALTIGATSKAGTNGAETLASFSSRGPAGDTDLKPDITAPGVSICAAQWANAFSYGQCLDSEHTAINGTSMATPHVSGAAALLSELHPELEPLELKALIQNSAKPLGLKVYEGGSGRVDLVRALNTQAIAMPGSIDFGLDDLSLPIWQVTRTFQLRNLTAQPTTYTFTLDPNRPLPTGVTLQFQPSTVDLAASESVTLTLDLQVNNSLTANPTTAPYNIESAFIARRTGAVPADQGSLRIPFSFIKSPSLRVHFDQPANALVIHNRAGVYQLVYYPPQDKVVYLPAGTWDVMATYWDNTATYITVIREGVVVSTVHSLDLSSTQATLDHRLAYVSETGVPTRIAIGSSSLVHKASKLALSLELGIPTKYRYSPVSSAYRWDWTGMSGDESLPKVYRFAGALHGISAAAVHTNTPQQLIPSIHRFDPGGITGQVIPINWITTGPSLFSQFSFTSWDTQARIADPANAWQQYWRMPAPPDLTYGYEYKTLHYYRGGSFSPSNEPAIWRTAELRTPQDPNGGPLQGTALGGQPAGIVGLRGDLFAWFSNIESLFPIQNGLLTTGGTAFHWNGKFSNLSVRVQVRGLHGSAYSMFLDGRYNTRTNVPIPSYELLDEAGNLVQTNGANLFGIPLMAQEGAFELRVNDSSGWIAGAPARVEVRASFDTRRSDGNPPLLTRMETYSTQANGSVPPGELRSRFSHGEPVRLRIEIRDEVQLGTVQAWMQDSTGQTELVLIPESLTSKVGTYVAEIPTHPDQGPVDLTLQITDAVGNRLTQVSKPVLYVDSAPLMATGTPTPTWTQVPSPTSTLSPSPTSPPTNTASPSATATLTPTQTASPTVTWIATETPTFTSTASPTSTPTDTATAIPTATPTFTSTASPTSTRTAMITPSPSGTWTATATSTPTPSASSTPTPTATATATSTLSPSPTSTRTATPTPSPSSTWTVTATSTPTPSQSATTTSTETSSPPPTQTASVAASQTPSATASPSSTPAAPTATATATRVATPTPTLTPGVLSFVSSTLSAGMPVQILGNLPQGTYRVCIVPSQPIAHSVGALYSGELVSCVDAPTGRLQFGPITVWDKARAGQYDAVALRSDADWTILAGDDLGPSPGLQVSAQVSAVQDPSRTLLVLLLLTLGLLHRRDGRFQHRSNPRLKAIRQREPG